MSLRAEREIAHGRMLAASGAEDIWGWGTPAGRRRFERRAELIAAGAGLRPGLRVMEIGCGTGNFTELFARSGAHLTAVDISPDLLALARQRGLPAGQVDFVQARFEDVDAREPFDAVIGSSVLHHLEIEAAFRTIYRLLKPGGAISFAEPNMLNPQVYAMFHFGPLKEKFGLSPDERAFYRWRLARQLRSAGFAEVRLTPFDFLHPATPPSLIPLVSRMGGLAERAPLLREIAGSLCIFARKPQAA